MDDFFDDGYLEDENVKVTLDSEHMFYRLQVQSDWPTMELGFRDLISQFSKIRSSLAVGAVFNTRGQQELHLSGNLEKVVPGVTYFSTLKFDTWAQDVSQVTDLNYEINPELETRLHVEIADGDIEAGAGVTKQINEQLTLEGYLSYVKNLGSIDTIDLIAKYRPTAFLETEIGYENFLSDDECSTPFPYGNLKFKCLLTPSNFIRMGFDFHLDMDDQKPAYWFGLESTAFKDTILKGKVSHEGEAQAAARFRLWDNIQVLASSKVNLVSMRSEMETDFGIGLEYSF